MLYAVRKFLILFVTFVPLAFNSVSIAFGAPGDDLHPPTDDQKYDDIMKLELGNLASSGKVFEPSDLIAAAERPSQHALELPEAHKNPIDDGAVYRQASLATFALYTCTAKNARAEVGGVQLGCAFVVNAKGVALTCFHAIRFNESFVIAACDANGKKVRIKNILAVFPCQDIAVIQLEGDSFDSLPLRQDAPAGTRLCVLGHPASLHFFMTEGLLARYETLPPRLPAKATRPHMDLAIQTAQGFSGGPILDACGNAIGMQDTMRTIQRGDENYSIGLGIPARMLSSCLTKEYQEQLSVEELRLLLSPDAPGSGSGETIISNSRPEGTVYMTKSGNKITVKVIELSTGNILLEGTPSSEFRDKLPAWAKTPYDENIESLRQDRLVNPAHEMTSIEADNPLGKVIAELDGITIRKVSVWDASGRLIAVGVPGDAYREKLPEWARSVYDADMRAASNSKDVKNPQK